MGLGALQTFSENAQTRPAVLGYGMQCMTSDFFFWLDEGDKRPHIWGPPRRLALSPVF